MSIEKRGNKYRVTLTIQGKFHRGTFDTLKEAKAFSRNPSGYFEDDRNMSFKELLELYSDQVAKYHKGAKQDILRVKKIQRDVRISSVKISQLQVRDFDDYFCRRLKVKTNRNTTVCECTLKKERAIMHSALQFAIRKGYIESNPMTGVMKLRSLPPRERIASDQEIAMLCQEAGWYARDMPKSVTQRVVAAFVFSTLTGMRLGEICELERSWISHKSISLPAEATKTNRRRDVALSSEARKLLSLLLPLGYPKVFGLHRGSVTTIFRRLRDKLGFTIKKDSHGNVIQEALRFHDGRATFCTHAAQKLPPLALARQLGHTDIKMTMRYYRESADRIADLLD